MTIEQQLDLERDDRRHESPVARLAGRLKSACCRQCGSADGMRAVHRDTMDSMPAEALRLLDTLYYASGNSAYLFYACHCCNRDKIIPGGFSALGLDDMLCWINLGRPRPNCDALAREPEAATAGQDSRNSAG